MARTTSPVAFLATAAALLLASPAAEAQRPALAGERARVAEAVKRDLTRLATLQRTYHSRAKVYASDLKDLNFTPTSGAEVNIAFASMNTWAANASHAVLAPLKCFIIVSATDAADAARSQPICTDADPNTPAGRVAAAGAATEPAATSAPATAAAATAGKAPAQAAADAAPPARAAETKAAPRSTTTKAPARAAAPPRATPATRPAVSAPAEPAAASAMPAAAPARAAVRMITRDAGAATLADRVEPVTAAEFALALNGMAREAIAVMDAPPPEVVRDPYESTQEFEARRAQALAEYERREQEYFRTTKRSFVVQLPVRAVRYDADAEMLEFAVEGLRLPSPREGRSQLTVACFTRPVFWCMPEAGMSYDANDLWKVPRATARQFDVLRTPLTLTARFTVGGRPEGERALAISLVDLELMARGQVVQRWAGR